MYSRFSRISLLLVSACIVLPAQVSTGTLRGRITDAAGAPVAGVTVVINGAATEADSRQLETLDDGTYAAPYLNPGSYRIWVERKGFRLFSAADVQLEPGQERRVDAIVDVDAEADAPTVTIGGTSLRTDSGALTGSIDLKSKWPDAPVVDLHPSPIALMTTLPSVQGNGHGLVISGIPDRDKQSWAIDGQPHDTSSQSNAVPNFYDVLEVSTTNAGVESARPVAWNVVTKHGGNMFHGSVYGKRINSGLNARSYFDAVRTPYTESEAGAEISGALIPGRTFYYAGWMYQKNPYNQTRYADVPTDLMRDRDFSQYLDAATSPTGKAVVVRDPRTGVPFPNNVIPASRLNSVSQLFLTTYYPSANLGDDNSFTGNYYWNHKYGPDVFEGHWPVIRVDQKISSRNTIYFRWLLSQTKSLTAGSLAEKLTATQGRRYQNLAVADTHVFSPTVVNYLTVGRTGLFVHQGEEEDELNPVLGSDVISATGLQGTNIKSYQSMGFPTISISGLTGLSMPFGGGADKNAALDQQTYTVEDSLTWTQGRHSLKFGWQQMRYVSTDETVPQTVYGSFNFTGAYSGLAFADFILGLPTTSARENPIVGRRVIQNQAGLYLADSFRVNRRLTVDYGLRWDYYGSPAYSDGLMYNWDAATGQVIVTPGTITSISSLYPKAISVATGEVVPKANTRNFRPRVAAAYAFSDRMVLRAGYGEYTESWGYGSNGRLNAAGPYSVLETYTNSLANGVAAISFPRPFPSSSSTTTLASQSVTALPMKTEEGVIRQYNLTLEHEHRGLSLRGSFLGACGTGMNYKVDINKPQAGTTAFSTARLPYPQFGTTYMIRNDGEWHYDALQLEAQKRAHTFLIHSSFTWANNISNYANTVDPYSVTNHWTRDASTRRLYFVTSGSWDLPVGKGRTFLTQTARWVNAAISNWSLQAISTFASGQYYSPAFTGLDPANASTGYVTQLPDCVGDPNSGARTLSRWFNPAAFAIPSQASGRYGSCGMNILEGYPLHVAHISLIKRATLGEGKRLTFTAQVSNLTNSAHFLTPNANISEPGAGAFTATSAAAEYSPERQGARQVALRVRLDW